MTVIDSEYISQVLSSAPIILPPNHQKVGRSFVDWWEPTPGYVVIMGRGGSCDDRTLAEQAVKLDLEKLGYRRIGFTLDWHMSKTSNWDDIMSKAKRLIQSGNVTVLRNGFNNVVGHVVGDHGEYNVEIGRDDPESRTITTWQCECPWDQYAWQRTRKWKKYEGRPCAHVMALYWKSLATPLDEDLSPEQAQAMGTGQKLPGSSPSQPGGPPVPVGVGGPPAEAGPPPQAAEAPMPSTAPPAAPGVLPPAPMDQMPQMPPMPGQTPAGMPAPPNSVSVPGARPPSPFNPIQYPGGTYSSADISPHIPEIEKIANGFPKDDDWCGTTTDAVSEYLKNHGVDHAAVFPYDPSYHDGGVLWNNDHYDESHAWIELPNGTIIDPTISQFDAAPRPWPGTENTAIIPPGHPYAMHYHTTHSPYRYNPNAAKEGYDDKDPNDPQISVVQDNYTYDPNLAKEGKLSNDFQPDQTVNLKNDAYGLTEGREGAIDAGNYVEVPAGSQGSVLYQDPTTGWVEAIFPLEGGRMTSYHVRCFLEPSDLKPSSVAPPGPFIRRRSPT